MNIRFYVDPETSEPHIYRHRVTENEAAEVIQNPGEDRSGGKVPESPSGRAALVVTYGSSMFRNRMVHL